MLYDDDMKYISIKICLVIVALFGGVAVASDSQFRKSVAARCASLVF